MLFINFNQTLSLINLECGFSSIWFPLYLFISRFGKKKKTCRLFSELLVTTTILQIWKVKALSINIDTYKEKLSLYTFRYI